MSTHQLMNLLKISELKLMFPNLTKLVAIGLLLLMLSTEEPNPSDFPYDTACDKWAATTNRRINVEILSIYEPCSN